MDISGGFFPKSTHQEKVTHSSLYACKFRVPEDHTTGLVKGSMQLSLAQWRLPGGELKIAFQTWVSVLRLLIRHHWHQLGKGAAEPTTPAPWEYKGVLQPLTELVGVCCVSEPASSAVA